MFLEGPDWPSTPQVNPFGLTDENEVVCFDAKINFDDNASFRQKDIFAMEDTSETDPR